MVGLFDILGFAMLLELTTTDKTCIGVRHSKGGRAFSLPGHRAHRPPTKLCYVFGMNLGLLK